MQPLGLTIVEVEGGTGGAVEMGAVAVAPDVEEIGALLHLIPLFPVGDRKIILLWFTRLYFSIAIN